MSTLKRIFEKRGVSLYIIDKFGYHGYTHLIPEKRSGMWFGVELELSGEPWQYIQDILYKTTGHVFIPSHDATAGTEWVSTPMRATDEMFEKVSKGIQDVLAIGLARVCRTCGTHVHFGPRKSPNGFEELDKIVSMWRVVLEHAPRQFIDFWGRRPNRYCRLRVTDSHYNAIVLTTKTIEFRLPKFRTARRFIKTLRGIRAMFRYLDGEADFDHVKETLIDLGVHHVENYN